METTDPAAVKRRGGWPVDEGAHGRYVIDGDAADRYVARITCGLPVDSADFAVPPPYIDLPAAVLQAAVIRWLPGANGSGVPYGVCAFLLARVAFSHSRLLEMWPRPHPLHAHPIFARADEFRRDVLPHVRWGRPAVDAAPLPWRTTGVPRSVKLLLLSEYGMQMHRRTHDLLQQIIERQAGADETMKVAMREVFEESARVSGVPTRDYLDQRFERLEARLAERPAPPPSDAVRQQAADADRRMAGAALGDRPIWWNGGVASRVAPEWTFPTATVADLTRYWYYGSAGMPIGTLNGRVQRGCLPWRELRKEDLAGTGAGFNQRRRHHAAMTRFFGRAEAALGPPPGDDRVDAWVDALFPALGVQHEEPRRLMWGSVIFKTGVPLGPSRGSYAAAAAPPAPGPMQRALHPTLQHPHDAAAAAGWSVTVPATPAPVIAASAAGAAAASAAGAAAASAAAGTAASAAAGTAASAATRPVDEDEAWRAVCGLLAAHTALSAREIVQEVVGHPVAAGATREECVERLRTGRAAVEAFVRRGLLTSHGGEGPEELLSLATATVV